MKSDKERMEILEKASTEIEEVCMKYGVVIAMDHNCAWVHHGEWHEKSGDYSVREMKLSDKCML